MSDRAKNALAALAVALLLLGVIAARIVHDGGMELANGADAMAHGQTEDAIRFYRRAAHWYLPGNATSARALDALAHIAADAEAHGRPDLALAALRAIRASVRGTGWGDESDFNLDAHVNPSIARLMAATPPSAAEYGIRQEQRENEYSTALRWRHPEAGWLFATSFGFLVWLAAAAHVTWHGWDEEDRPRWRTLGVCALLVVVGMSLFLTGLARA